MQSEVAMRAPSPESGARVVPEPSLKSAQALEQAGRWGDAQEEYAALFRLAAVRADLPGMAAAAYFQARACNASGQAECAEELALLCLQLAEVAQLDQQLARARNLLAVTRFTQGDHDEAWALYGQALEEARDIGDDRLIAFICQNMGVIANVRGDLREARLLYLESIGTSVLAADESSASMVYNNLGMVCTDLGDWVEAELYFERGLEIAERVGDQAQIARLYSNRAEPLIRIEDMARARSSLDMAEEVAGRIGARTVLTDAARFRAMALRLEGELEEAEAALARALDLAQEPLAAAECQEELAHLRAAQGRVEEAIEAAGRAVEGYRALQAERDAGRVEEMATRWGAGVSDRQSPASPRTADTAASTSSALPPRPHDQA